MPPAPTPNEPPGTPIPAEVERRLRELSQPGAADSPYVLAPPPTAGPGGAGTRVVQTAGRAADAGMAAVAHFAILFGFLGIGFLISLAISGVIWLYSRRSPYVAFHAQQAGCYQLFLLGFNLGCAALLGVLLALNIYLHWEWAGTAALLLVVLFIAWFPISILYGAWGGLMVLMGRNFRYPYLGRRR
jgi:hypothetical protein